MKKHAIKKLTLTRETLQWLEADRLLFRAAVDLPMPDQSLRLRRERLHLLCGVSPVAEATVRRPFAAPSPPRRRQARMGRPARPTPKPSLWATRRASSPC
jgi:hypothetical protein